MNKGYFYILFATLFFSSMEVALKIVATDFNPLELNFLRFVIGTVVLWPMAIRSLKEKNLHVTKQHWPFFLLTGFLCVVVSMTFFQLAIMYAHASIVAILFSCNAIFVIPLAHVFLKQRMTWVSVGSLALSVVGMLFIVNPQHLPNVVGVTLSLLAAVTFALYGIVGQMGNRKYGFTGISLTFFSFIAGCIEMVVFMAFTHIPAVATTFTHMGLANFANIPFVQGISVHTLPALIYLGIFVTGFGYAFYFMAMEETSAATASVIFYIKPALAPILAMAVLGEVIHENTVIGIMFIIAGSALTFAAAGIDRRIIRNTRAYMRHLRFQRYLRHHHGQRHQHSYQ
ncbi:MULTISPECIES: DMT family transporter [Vibrio]|uniref:EamA family transporter n=2 Tax=Vibrio TaxID=662 RepID=A0A7X4LJL3_9VIBR|nr:MULTISPECIES: DMT family transporter [Vibrio]MBF9002363.1 EamA family transporter [Vibrio nitrifigilis]MZI93056.1 EamA family transporter [Vibrio eleionomae]